MSLPPIKPVQSKDRVPYRCSLCGNCCRNVKDQLMLEPLDACRLARFLRVRGQAEYLEDVYSCYAHPDVIDSYPIFLLNTTSPNDTCVFLKDGRCSIYEARPKVCRLYPFTVDFGQRGRAFEVYQCLDRHAAHFSGGQVQVKDWMYQNFSREDKEFLTAESTALPDLNRLLKSLGPEGLEHELFHVLYYIYFNYDLEQPFMPQYVKNMEDLKKVLRNALEGR